MKFTTEFVNKYWHLLEALKEGKTLQLIPQGIGRDDWVDNICDFSCPPEQYRIKPEPEYRPLTPAEAAKYLGTRLVHNSGGSYTIKSLGIEEVMFTDQYKASYQGLLNHYTFSDGSPVGVEV